MLFTITNWAVVIEQLKAMQETISKLLALLESSEADKFLCTSTKLDVNTRSAP